jgi:hypothetical protein
MAPSVVAEANRVYTLSLTGNWEMSDTAVPARSNRRLTARKACRLTVHYRSQDDWHPATAMDLSPNGCRLRLGEDLLRGSGVNVQFEAPLRDGAVALSVEVPGRVMWSRLEGLSYQVGIHFVKPPDGLDDILSAIG